MFILIKKPVIRKSIFTLVRGENYFESSLKRFKKSCQNVALFAELKGRREYLKPSARKKRKREEAQKKYHRLRKLNSGRTFL